MKKLLLLIVLLLFGFYLENKAEEVNQEQHYKTEISQGN